MLPITLSIALGIVIHIALASLKDIMFDFQNDELCSKKSSLLKINDVLPKEFLEQTLFTFTIIVSLLASEYFYDFNKLFEESNVRLINSYYFGTQSCLKKNPVQNNLFQMLETFELNRGEFRKSKENQKSSMDMAMELVQYITNF